MKRHHQRYALCGFALITLSLALAQGEGQPQGTFDLSWNTLDGGGGTSSAAGFELAGTIGQPDAPHDSGTLTGGGPGNELALVGGFWATASAPSAPCPGDLAPSGGDGAVNVADLLELISAWGLCTGCAEDFVPPGGNGTVNVDDLLGVIGAWGACP
jgi:hypothetical protein